MTVCRSISRSLKKKKITSNSRDCDNSSSCHFKLFSFNIKHSHQLKIRFDHVKVTRRVFTKGRSQLNLQQHERLRCVTMSKRMLSLFLTHFGFCVCVCGRGHKEERLEEAVISCHTVCIMTYLVLEATAMINLQVPHLPGLVTCHPFNNYICI